MAKGQVSPTSGFPAAAGRGLGLPGTHPSPSQTPGQAGCYLSGAFSTQEPHPCSLVPSQRPQRGGCYCHLSSRPSGLALKVDILYFSCFPRIRSCRRVSPWFPGPLRSEEESGRWDSLPLRRNSTCSFTKSKLSVAMDTESTYSGYSYYSSHSKKSHRQGYVSYCLFHFSFGGNSQVAQAAAWAHFQTVPLQGSWLGRFSPRAFNRHGEELYNQFTFYSHHYSWWLLSSHSWF